jgi:hypothetical protein
MQVPLVTMSCPFPRTAAPPRCLPLDIKDSLKEDVRLSYEGGFLMGGFWLREIAEGRISEGKRTTEGELLKRG